MDSAWTTCGPDTAHITFKEGFSRSPLELSSLLAEFQRSYDLPTDALIRDRGLQGFENAAIDKAAGLRLDWTLKGGNGNNPGFFCLQIKGAWFEAADGETASDFLQLIEAYGPYRVTRLDIQQTIRTDTRLTPWWIEEFESGRLRVIGKKHYEPRGKKDHFGLYPEGSTLYHGSRSSERYARQYDKHLQSGDGPPRRRDEVEVKGESARNLWKEMQERLLDCEQQGISRGATLHTFSKGTIRALLPIRDTSRWAGTELPKKWSGMAKEPATWATLFDQDPIQVKPRERKVSSMLRSYRYAKNNFGSAISAMVASRMAESRDTYNSAESCAMEVYAQVIDEMTLAAREDRVMEFLAELPPDHAQSAREWWFSMLRTSSSVQESRRDG